MKAIALICLILLTPVVASEPERLVTEQYRKRIQEVQQETHQLEQDIFSTLQAEPEVLTAVREQIEAIYNESNLPKLFLTELDSFLQKLRYPEELLSEEQRKNLTYSPNLQDLEPIDMAIGKLEKSIQHYQDVATFSKDLGQEASETLLYQDEWSQFIAHIIQKINENTLTNRDLSEIYEWVIYFHDHLKRIETIRNQLDHLPPLDFYQDKYHKDFMGFPGKIADFFRSRGGILWELIRNLNLFDLLTNYEEMASNDFRDPKNPIKKFIESNSEDTKIGLQENTLNKRTSIHFIRAFLDQLRNAFKQPSPWEKEIKACQVRTTLLLNAKRIIKPLKQVVDYYRCFKSTYWENLGSCYDSLTPKARLVIPGHPLAIISQSFAKRASSLLSNGSFCVGMPNYDKATALISEYETKLIDRKLLQKKLHTMEYLLDKSD